MKVTKTFKPHQNGAKRFFKQYQDQLVAVRYRQEGLKQYTTIELIVDEKDIDHKLHYLKTPVHSYSPEDYLPIRVQWNELEDRHAVKSAGGLWQQSDRVWALPFPAVTTLGLQNRIVENLKEKYLNMDFYM